MSKRAPKKDQNERNFFEHLLQGLKVRFNPEDRTLTLRLPKAEEIEQAPRIETPQSVNTVKAEPHVEPEEIEILEDNTSIDTMTTDSKIVRVRLATKAYIKLALHAIKYANENISKRKWVEVIGLLTGKIENRDNPLACLYVTDAFPIGHGTDVNVHIQNPQSHVKVYQSLKRGESILGWYHSHPSYTPFMSQTDYGTQVRYQRLSKAPQMIAPVALVIDPTMITTKSYGFKIFRLKENYKQFEEPTFEVENLPVESLPGILETLLPLAKGDTMFLEYDHN